MNGKPCAAQKKWHEFLIGYGCSVDINRYPVSLHHIKGSKMKLKGLINPGEWYVIPLSYWWHQDGKNNAARHVNKKMFEAVVGRTEKMLFKEVVEKYEQQFGEKPMMDFEFNEIMDRA